MISIAFTKAVVWKGRIRVSHSQWVKMARINAAVEARQTNHQNPLYFFVCSIISKFMFPAKTGCDSAKIRLHD